MFDERKSPVSSLSRNKYSNERKAFSRNSEYLHTFGINIYTCHIYRLRFIQIYIYIYSRKLETTFADRNIDRMICLRSLLEKSMA